MTNRVYTPEEIESICADASRLYALDLYVETHARQAASLMSHMDAIIEQQRNDLSVLKETCDENTRLEKSWKQEIARVEKLRKQIEEFQREAVNGVLKLRAAAKAKREKIAALRHPENGYGVSQMLSGQHNAAIESCLKILDEETA